MKESANKKGSRKKPSTFIFIPSLAVPPGRESNIAYFPCWIKSSVHDVHCTVHFLPYIHAQFQPYSERKATSV